MRLLPLLLTILFAGCYVYAPAPSTTPRSGARIRAELTPAGAERTFGQLGPHVGTVAGQVLTVRGDTLVLRLDGVWTREGSELFWPDDRITVPADALAGLRQRTFSLTRTVLFVGGLLAVPAILDLVGGDGPQRVPTGNTKGPGGPSQS